MPRFEHAHLTIENQPSGEVWGCIDFYSADGHKRDNLGTHSNWSAIHKALARLGTEGWELVTVNGANHYWFKRSAAGQA